MYSGHQTQKLEGPKVTCGGNLLYLFREVPKRGAYFGQKVVDVLIRDIFDLFESESGS